VSAETVRREQDGRSLSPEDQVAFDGIVDHYYGDDTSTPEEYRTLTKLNFSRPVELPDQDYIEQRLAAMTAKFHETQALLPPYEDTVRWEARSEKTSLWKRVTGFFNRRKGSEQAWYPEQRPIVTRLAMGSTALVEIMPHPDYPSTLTNTQERRV